LLVNAAEQKKLAAALAQLGQMEVQLNNLSKRGPRAGQALAVIAGEPGDDMRRKAVKALAAGVTQIARDGKTVSKDIAAIFASATEKQLNAYGGTAKQYRDQVLAKRLVSSKSFDLNGQRVLLRIESMRDQRNEYPGWKDPDMIITVNSLKGFSENYNQMRILFAKL
jgi:hypothetical protein